MDTTYIYYSEQIDGFIIMSQQLPDFFFGDLVYVGEL